MSTEIHKHRTIPTIRAFLDDAIEMHLPPNSREENRQVDLFCALLNQLPNTVLDTKTDICCGQSVIFKISQIYPLITVWRCPTALINALVREIKMMYGIIGD